MRQSVASATIRRGGQSVTGGLLRLASSSAIVRRIATSVSIGVMLKLPYLHPWLGELLRVFGADVKPLRLVEVHSPTVEHLVAILSPHSCILVP